jgi:hypothetical protein
MNRKRRIAMILAPWVFTALPTLLLVAAGWRTAPAQEAVPETTPLLLSQKNKQTALKRDAEFKEIHFTITTDKARYAQGETVTLTLSAYNRGTKPATVALPLFDGGVSPSVTLAVVNAKTDEPLRISQGEFYAGRERQEAVQVMVHPQVAAKRFVIVPPGETVPIASKKFERAYLPGNRAPQRKSEMTAAERNAIPNRADSRRNVSAACRISLGQRRVLLPTAFLQRAEVCGSRGSRTLRKRYYWQSVHRKRGGI